MGIGVAVLRALMACLARPGVQQVDGPLEWRALPRPVPPLFDGGPPGGPGGGGLPPPPPKKRSASNPPPF